MKEGARLRYVVKLGKYIKGLWGRMALAFLFNILFKVVPIGIGFVTSYMIGLTVLGNTGDIWALFFTAIVLILLSGVLAYMDVLVSHDTTYRILTTLRNIAYDKIDELAPAAMEGRHSAELTSIVLEDVEQLEWFYAHTIGQLIVAVVVPAAALILLGQISWPLTLSMLPFIALMICIPLISTRKSDAQGLSVRIAYADLNAQIVDGVQGLKDIICFGWQKQYFARLLSAMHSHSAAQLAYAKRSGNETRSFQFVIGAGSLTGQAIAALLVIRGELSAVWLVPIFTLCSAIFVPIQDALTMSINYGLIFGAAKRLFDLFQAKPTVQDTGTLTSDAVMRSAEEAPMVSFDHVAFTYPSENPQIQNAQLLRDISFHINANETVALVGASGSGKTTLSRLLLRFWDVDSGSVRIRDTDIRELSLDALRDLVTVVPQEVYLFNLSVAENLRLAKLDATEEEIHAAAAEAQASAFIERLPDGYDTVLGERGFRLSGGEKQRLAIAQAFLRDTPVLVLDEASANLDSETERQINLAVDTLKKGRATLVIAHRVSTIRQADRIVLLRDGRIEATGTYDDLLSGSAYFRQLLVEGEYEEQN